MRAKSLLLLVVALGCGMVAAVSASKFVTTDSGAAEPTVEIYVASERLATNTRITPQLVKLESWPKNRVPEGAVRKLEELEEKFTKLPIFKDEPILAERISEKNESMAGSLPPGYRLFDIKNSKTYIKPGDHVDITGIFKLGGGRRGSKGSVKSETVMRDVVVHAINGSTIRDPDEEEVAPSKGGRTFQLLIKESQLEALELANNMGNLDLKVRPSSDHGTDSEVDNGEDFMAWVKANEDDLKEEPAKAVTTSLAPLMTSITTPEPKAEDEKSELKIITPSGIVVYQYSAGEIPKPVLDSPEVDTAQPAPNPWAQAAASGNVYSGPGGFSPTYPTGTSPQSVPTPPADQAGGDGPSPTTIN